MAKGVVVEMKRRAPAVAAKLEAAREVLRELERDVGQFALDVAEGSQGAAKRLADLRTTIANAQRDVSELEKAHVVAARLDRQSDAASATGMRQEQFAIMKACAETRLKAVATIMDSIATASKAYHEYVVATNEMVVSLPTGTRMGHVMMGRNGTAGNWVGNLEELIAAEAWRLLVVDEQSRMARLPFSKAPEMTNDDRAKQPPGLDVMTEAQASVLRSIEAQMSRLNAEDMTLAEGVAA